ncbi:MAG: porin [Planctomycetaceae bacterium]|nr:porin [Planctomycetaceae bacterium]
MVRFLVQFGLCSALWCVFLLGNLCAQQIAPQTSSPAESPTLQQIQWRLQAQQREITQLREELHRSIAAPPLPTPNNQQEVQGRATLNGSLRSSPSPLENPIIAQLSEDQFTQVGSSQSTGLNLNTYTSLFDEGIVIESDDVALKIGGYVKVDFIKDFNPIADEFAFNTRTIEVNARDRENSNVHARQSRLNFDTRWNTEAGPVRAFIEADFFGAGNAFRLRHAYGEVQSLIVGQTWSTFANVRALPPTLDNEGSASVISRRQGQIRWTEELLVQELTFSLAIEDPQLALTESFAALDVRGLNESPDLVTRFKYSDDDTSFMLAAVVRQLGAITPSGSKIEQAAWGTNFSMSHRVTSKDEGYMQIVVGEGIGSYKGIADVVTDGISRAGLLPALGWMVGWNHRWTEQLQSNLTYSENVLDNPGYQPGDELHRNTYFATNVIWAPAQNFFTGIEYLYGIRENVNGDDAEAHRLQTSFGFYLP